MPYVQTIVEAGKTVEVTKGFSSRYNKKGITRGKNEKPTSEQMAVINERNAETKLRRSINANFGHGDLHITLTYQKEARPIPEDAKKELGKYLNSLRKLFKKTGEEFRYITVTEYQNKAIHHHLVVNMVDGIPAKEFDRLWKMGRTRFTYLDDTGQYGALAHYLIKETRKTYKDEGSPSKKRWNSSRNLKKPVITKKIIKAKEWRKEPKPLKGYMLERDTIKEGYHDFTGWPFQFYSMVRYGDDDKEKRRSGKNG